MRALRMLLSSVLALLVAVSMQSQALAITVDKSLNIPNVKQEHDQWCWAGSSLTILNYFLIYTDQCTFVSYVKTGTTSPTKCDNLPATILEAQSGLNYFGVSSTYTASSISWGSTKTEINNSRPIFVAIAWLGANNQVTGGHAVVIDGYLDDTNLATTEVKYMDPWDGTHHAMDYSAFTYTQGSQQWTGTLSNTAKKP